MHFVYYLYNTHRRSDMDIIRNIQPRDWAIAIAAFLAGAFIF